VIKGSHGRLLRAMGMIADSAVAADGRKGAVLAMAMRRHL
jgi:hypothetical protein